MIGSRLSALSGHGRHILFCLVAVGFLSSCAPTQPTAQQPKVNDLLPSWNEGVAKQVIIQFCDAAVDPASASYVSPEERIAVFDNDGTLWPEKPLNVELTFAIERLRRLAPAHPQWLEEQPFAAVLQNHAEYLSDLEESDLLKIFIAAETEITNEEFVRDVKRWLETARHPRFGGHYTDLAYQPMLELLAYLRSRAFQIYICSGSDMEFLRTFAPEVYGILPENVIGNSALMEFRPSSTHPMFFRLPKPIEPNNNRGGKPVNIKLRVGRIPIIAVGNSDGDIQMLQLVDGQNDEALILLLNHDDAQREYAYDEGAEEVLEAAKQSQWTIVSMKKDFKVVFPFSR